MYSDYMCRRFLTLRPTQPFLNVYCYIVKAVLLMKLLYYLLKCKVLHENDKIHEWKDNGSRILASTKTPGKQPNPRVSASVPLRCSFRKRSHDTGAADLWRRFWKSADEPFKNWVTQWQTLTTKSPTIWVKSTLQWNYSSPPVTYSAVTYK